MPEVPDEWLIAVHDAYRDAFGQRELNLVAPGLPTVIDAVRPLIEARLLEQFDTEWAIRAFDRTTERPEITPKASEESARRSAHGMLGVEVMRRRVGRWAKAPKEAATDG